MTRLREVATRRDDLIQTEREKDAAAVRVEPPASLPVAD
jgi:hypothetical protein